MSKINNDLAKVKAVYGDSLHRVVLTVMQGIGATTTMFILDWRLALITLTIGVLAAFINIAFAEPIRKFSDRIQKHLGLSTRHLVDIVSGLSTLKMFNIRNIVLDKFRAENNIVAEESLKRITTNAQMKSINFVISFLNLVGIVCIGSFMLNNHTIDLGTIIAIMTLQNSSNNLFLRLGGFFANLQNNLAGAARIFELLDEEEESYTDKQKDIGKEKQESGWDDMIVYHDVSFTYEGKELVLEGLNLSVKKGQKIALVGPSGGGKSTMIKLLMGFYPINQGEIIIGGKLHSNYNLKELRDMMSYVSQEANLFNTTIEENIRYGNLMATDEEVTMAARAANAHDFICEMPEGYQTVVGERGTRLSGGQKQRIALARAILKDAPILLLDEATSALDSESEKLVEQAFKKFVVKRTVITVAHRLSTIETADIIYVIKNGKVIEKGAHQELLDQKGFYCSLVV